MAGGTGLTPHWQFIHAVLSDPSDMTLISLLDRYVRNPFRASRHRFMSCVLGIARSIV